MHECKKCDDTGTLDHAGFGMDPCPDCNAQLENSETRMIAAFALKGMLAHPRRYRQRDEDADLHWHHAIAKEAFDIAEEMAREAQVRNIT